MDAELFRHLQEIDNRHCQILTELRILNTNLSAIRHFLEAKDLRDNMEKTLNG